MNLLWRNALYHSRNDIILFASEFLENRMMFCLVQPLKDNLPCRLSSDSPGIRGCRFYAYSIANLGISVALLSFVKGYLMNRISGCLSHHLPYVDLDFASVGVDLG